MRIYGSVLDAQTRCKHYHSQYDIIAIRFACCNDYYPCFACHVEHAGHPVQRWQAEEDLHQKAILCGNCKTEWTIGEYFHSSKKCLSCEHPFNAKCQNHWSLYFDPALFKRFQILKNKV